MPQPPSLGQLWAVLVSVCALLLGLVAPATPVSQPAAQPHLAAPIMPATTATITPAACPPTPETPVPGSTPARYPTEVPNAAPANDRDEHAVREAASIPITPSIFPAPSVLTATAIHNSQFIIHNSAAQRVVLQAGHWHAEQMPDEMAYFRDNYGAWAGGRQEWQVNLEVANRAAVILQQRGYNVTVIGATIPPNCTADAFVALHADADSRAKERGYKAARAADIDNPASLRLLADTYIEYGAATTMPRHPAITFNMSGYYGFNYQHFRHAVNPTTPAIVLEMGYMSSPADRRILYETPDVAALGVANGIDRFLQGK